MWGGLGVHFICTQNPGIARKGEVALPLPLCQDFFGGFVHNALGALQSDHSSQKMLRERVPKKTEQFAKPPSAPPPPPFDLFFLEKNKILMWSLALLKPFKAIFDPF